MSQAALSGSDAHAGAPPSKQPLLLRALTIITIGGLLAFIAHGVRTLWSEWSVLQGELSSARLQSVIGYPGIHPTPSFAQRPRPWLRTEGDRTLLWAGWRDGVGHSWFKVGAGELDSITLTPPMGRDHARAIDVPLVEVGGGDIWARIPDEAYVVGDKLGGVETAYPLVVLNKVTIVNDVIDDHPFLVTYHPQPRMMPTVRVYEPIVKGQRVTLGPAGCFHKQMPVLYDRGTESLWISDGEALRAVAGTHKGAVMKQVATLQPVAWSQWRSDHPKSRLVVGADRNAPRPAL